MHENLFSHSRAEGIARNTKAEVERRGICPSIKKPKKPATIKPQVKQS